MQGVAAAMGPPCNAVSIKNHIAKLRAMAREQKLGGNSSDPGSASGNATATSSKKGGTPKIKDATKAKGGAKKSAVAKNAIKFAGGDSDEENGSDDDATMNKKKVNGVKKGPVSKKRKNVDVKDEYAEHCHLTASSGVDLLIWNHREDDGTHKKVKIEEEGSDDDKTISEADPSSDQLVAELEASADR